MSVTLQAAAAATGNGNPLDVTGAPAAALQVSGTFVGTVIFEQTTDGVAWRRLPVLSTADGTASTQATAPGTFTAAVVSATGVRARVSAYTSGNITVIGQAGAPLPPLAADVPTLTLSKISDAGNAASKNTGTTGSTVALGNHTHAGAGLSDVTPLVESGVGAAGTGTAGSREDHVHPAAGGGAVAPLVLGTPAFSFAIPDPPEDGGTGYKLVVAGAVADVNDQTTTMIVGCDNPLYALDGLDTYSGTGNAVYAKATGVNGIAVVARATGVGGTGVSSVVTATDAVGVWGYASDDGVGVLAQTGSGIALEVIGPTLLRPITAPETPGTNEIVLYNQGGVLKCKADDGYVTTLAGRTP